MATLEADAAGCAQSRRSEFVNVRFNAIISSLVSSAHHSYCGDGNFLAVSWVQEGEQQMAFEFGMFHEFQRTAGVTDEEAFATSFAEIDAAERWGLDAMWLAEIHVNPERSVCSAPLTLAGAIAARTKRMKVGTGVQVLPLCHPLRIAEEAATVDHLSRGRLIFGVGRSGFPRTYQAYGVSYAESRERFAEVLEILKRAWTQETFSFHGRFYDFDDICLVPKPYQTPSPPLRIAVN